MTMSIFSRKTEQRVSLETFKIIIREADVKLKRFLNHNHSGRPGDVVFASGALSGLGFAHAMPGSTQSALGAGTEATQKPVASERKRKSIPMKKPLTFSLALTRSARRWGVLSLLLALAFVVSSGQTPAQSQTPVYVGVIPKNQNLCPAGSEYITIYMDDEDKPNTSYMSGWTGATSHQFSDHVDGTRLGFCRVRGEDFGSLTLYKNLINWQFLPNDPQKANVGAYDYSVPKLRACLKRLLHAGWLHDSRHHLQLVW